MTLPPRQLLGYEFQHGGEILVDRDATTGLVVELMPQSRYARSDDVPLNRYGHGPFCRLRVPGLPATAGVYMVMLADNVMYVGIAQDLRQRWGLAGYGSIQPKNCYAGGQSTNCKVNNLVLQNARSGGHLDVYFLQTDDRATIERQLITAQNPPWNGRHRSTT